MKRNLTEYKNNNKEIGKKIIEVEGTEMRDDKCAVIEGLLLMYDGFNTDSKVDTVYMLSKYGNLYNARTVNRLVNIERNVFVDSR